VTLLIYEVALERKPLKLLDAGSLILFGGLALYTRLAGQV